MSAPSQPPSQPPRQPPPGAARQIGRGAGPTAPAPAVEWSRGTRTAIRVAGLLPYRLLGVPLARHAVERNMLLWRSQVSALVGGLIEPLLYLLVLGVGVGGLVGDDPRLDSTYGQFVAAGLLGAACMNAPMYESYNVFFKLRGDMYEAMGATPIDPRQLAVGEIMWIVVRVLLYATGFLVVAALLGLVTTWWALLSLPIAVLLGLAFASLTIAGVTWMRTWHDFGIIDTIAVPMFLFSATFYPLEVLPGWAQLLTQLLPLYHGVAALREVMTGPPSAAVVGHLLVLASLAAVGLRLSARRFDVLLRT